ncbi:unnamed protein product, partial [Notodromas monacha]
ICKGPPERPGIFVQSTKDGGVAREFGLKPGDQILECNGMTLDSVDFAQAVHFLKSAAKLDLRIKKGVAADLFGPHHQACGSHGESSGYNSSSSSVSGDTSAPCMMPDGGGGGEQQQRMSPPRASHLLTPGGGGAAAGIVGSSSSSSGGGNGSQNGGSKRLSMVAEERGDSASLDAVHFLKSAAKLDLRIKKGVAADLFGPHHQACGSHGESSGYNSSSSSVSGDTSAPCMMPDGGGGGEQQQRMSPPRASHLLTPGGGGAAAGIVGSSSSSSGGGNGSQNGGSKRLSMVAEERGDSASLDVSTNISLEFTDGLIHLC